MLTWLKLTLLPPFGAGLIRLLGKAVRIRTEGAEIVDDLYRRGHRIIIAFWHAQQLMMPLVYRGREAHILISQHRDGELIHRIVARFGFRSVRGSTTRGGAAALRQLIKLGRSGVDLVVTPDGPKGPRHVVQIGVIQVARATGLPILPVTFGCSKKKSSRAGTASLSRIPVVAACSSGEHRSGSPLRPHRRNLRPSDSSSRLLSTGSQQKLTKT
ncbi:MAG: lysophospholipid acyltransferase family protein [Nitrospiraceae bacterium]